MYIGYTPEQNELRRELRAYYDNLLTPDLVRELAHSEGVGPVSRSVVLQMGADGWLGIGWPEEYGGQGRGFIDQFIFFDESMRAGAPVPMLTINSVAPTIMKYGSQEQKDFFLPKILRGEIHFCIGYTEPDAGTDLASLKSRAERDGDEWVINGQKIFTSLATDADYVWLAVRTNPEASRHKGISMIIVPTATPGFKAVPIQNFGNFNTNYTFYEDVRVPYDNVVKGEGQGWPLIMEQLNHERVTLCSSGIMERALDDVRRYAQETMLADGRRLIDEAWVQHDLAWVHARVEVLRTMNWQVAWHAENGDNLDPAAASAVKVFGTEFYMEGLQKLLEVMGPLANVREGSPDAVLFGRLSNLLRGLHVLTFGGGTNELQRDLIAIFGLGLPGSPR
ncbi:MAG: acyl-CoA dehydrogenase family protein [Acidimicrobiales bacterium]